MARSCLRSQSRPEPTPWQGCMSQVGEPLLELPSSEHLSDALVPLMPVRCWQTQALLSQCTAHVFLHVHSRHESLSCFLL